YREALRLKKDYPEAHYNLGVALYQKGDVDGAIAAWREALRLKKDYPKAHCNPGHALRDQRRFAAALEALERGHQVGSKRADWRYPSAHWVQQCQRLVDLDARLSDIDQGDAQPKDAAEQLALAELCQRYKKRHADAARFYADAFAAKPALISGQLR